MGQPNDSLSAFMLKFIGLDCGTKRTATFFSLFSLSMVITVSLFSLYLAAIFRLKATHSHYIELLRTSNAALLLVIFAYKGRKWTEVSKELVQSLSERQLVELKPKFRLLTLLALLCGVITWTTWMYLDKKIHCIRFFYFFERELLGPNIDKFLCMIGHIFMAITHQVTFLSIVFYCQLWMLVDRQYSTFKEQWKRRLSCWSCSHAENLERKKTFSNLVAVYRLQKAQKRRLERSVMILPLIWFSRHFIEAYLCLMRANFSSNVAINDTIFFRFFAYWYVFTFTTIVIVVMIQVVDRVAQRDEHLTRYLLKNIPNFHDNESRFRELMLREELLYQPYIPLTIGGVAEIRSVLIPVFINILVPMAVMGINEIKNFPSMKHVEEFSYS